MDGNRSNCDFDFGLRYCICAVRRNPSAVPALSLVEWCASNGGYIQSLEFNLCANLNGQPIATLPAARARRVQKINQEILRVAEAVNAQQDLELRDKGHVRAAQGWLELGATVEAERELDRVSDAMQGHPDVILGRLRVWVRMDA